jgi:Uma2 family endonuclease
MKVNGTGMQKGEEGMEKDGSKQGTYTIRDREARNETRPSELIDGVLYDMAAPTFVHQLIAGEIYLQLQNCVRSHGEKCIPFMASADVRLDRDDKTMVMPDVFVVCDPGRIVGRNGRYLDGAPDLVFEVASPSTRKTDMGIKLEKYRRAGVREYWIVDYEKRKVIV